MDPQWFREEMLERFREPRNRKPLELADAVYSSHNPSCGDTLTLFVRFAESRDKKIISELTFTGTGCAISQVAADVLADHVKARSIEDIHAIDESKMLHLLHAETIAPGRRNCALLAIRTLQSRL